MTDTANVVRPIDERVADLRRALAKTFDFDGAMVALSMADVAALRAIEPSFYPCPAPATQLRESIATAHVERIAGKQARDTKKVSSELVSIWAYGTLDDCLPGWTDFDGRQGGQYIVANLGFDEKAGGAVYRVCTPEGKDPKHFLVSVSTQLLDD